MCIDIGDFAEVPDECPATTTCQVACVADRSECPTVCEAGLTLCLTGNCLPDCTVHDANIEAERWETPCGCDTLPVACPKVIDLLDNCATRFGNYYDVSAACIEAQEEAEAKLSYTGPWFIFVYVDFIVTTVLAIAWCFCNQKLAPVPASTMPMQAANHVTTGEWTQTGYRTTLLGTAIYLLVTFTLWLFQFLLFVTTLFYYMQQEQITRWPKVFENEVQVLFVFEMVWMVGIVWSLAFRYPSTGIRALFLRRCVLSSATHVAVVAPVKSIEVRRARTTVERTAEILWCPIDGIFRTIFSHPYDRPGLETVFCPVEKDVLTGTRSILHRMRRYVYNEETAAYVPGTMSVGTTLGDLLAQTEGLSQETVAERQGTAGPNVIPLQRPTILGSLHKEFSKTFYVYQSFMVWTWLNFQYYYMGIVNTIVRLGGGLVVAYFQHASDSLLYQLSDVEGEVSYVPACLSRSLPGSVLTFAW
jgi:Cation transporter/ATPase, N-terminus